MDESSAQPSDRIAIQESFDQPQSPSAVYDNQPVISQDGQSSLDPRTERLVQDVYQPPPELDGEVVVVVQQQETNEDGTSGLSDNTPHKQR